MRRFLPGLPSGGAGARVSAFDGTRARSADTWRRCRDDAIAHTQVGGVDGWRLPALLIRQSRVCIRHIG